MRNPSIHITKSSLIKILEDIFPNISENDKLADDIMIRAKQYAISNRSIEITNDRIEKKIKKVTASDKLDANIFARYLHLIRKKLKHRGIVQIKPNTKDWLLLKEITPLAIELCNEFNISKPLGFKAFIETGLPMMNKFALPKLISMAPSILERYGAVVELEDDDDKTTTEKIYNYYRTKIMSQVGFSEDYQENPIKYVCFYRARLQCVKLNVNPKLYIEAQFTQLEFTNRFPDPHQLYGEKATGRLSRYMAEKNLKLKNNEKAKDKDNN